MIRDNMDILPTAFSSKKRLGFDDKIPGVGLEKKMDSFLTLLVRDLKVNNCKLIGHVKGFADAHDNGHLMFSITGFDEKVRFKGKLLQEIAGIEFTINIIVYGIELLSVERVFEKAYEKFFG